MPSATRSARELDGAQGEIDVAYHAKYDRYGPAIVGSVTGENVNLSDDALRRLEEMWPGPGGEAPQAYAW